MIIIIILQAMNGRFFGGSKISVENWDGHTSFELEENEKVRWGVCLVSSAVNNLGYAVKSDSLDVISFANN